VNAPADSHVVRRRFAVVVTASAAMAIVIAGGGAAREAPQRTPSRAPTAAEVAADRADVREIAVLHALARATSPPPVRGRDLFAFYQPFASAPMAKAPALPPDVVVAPADSEIDRVEETLTLIGIAEEPGIDGPRRTAIISTHERLFLVSEGEPVGPRYRVSAISSDAAEVLDVATGAIRRLGFP
jgi:hypothetical protein